MEGRIRRAKFCFRRGRRFCATVCRDKLRSSEQFHAPRSMREATMIRTHLAIVTAALAAATVLSSTAQACISCSYTPSYGDSKSSAPSAAPARRERSYSRTEERRRTHTAKKRSIEREDTAKASNTSKEVETAAKAASEPANPQALIELSSITPAPGTPEPATKSATATVSAPLAPQAEIENSSISPGQVRPPASRASKPPKLFRLNPSRHNPKPRTPASRQLAWTPAASPRPRPPKRPRRTSLGARSSSRRLA